MWLSLLKYWQPIAAASAALTLALMLHTLDVHRIERNWEEKLVAQKLQSEEKCISDKKITQTTEQHYENLYANLLADTKRLRERPVNCISVTKPADSGDDAYKRDEPRVANGVTSTALYDFASECEVDRIKVITLQDYVVQITNR